MSIHENKTINYFKLVKSMNKLFIFSLNIFINNLLRLLSFNRRDENLWIFGCWGGEKYSDNSKYLYEFVSHNLPHINIIWITKNNTIKKRLNDSNLSCYMYNEFQGYKSRLNAGYVFFTNSMRDFGNFDLCHGSIKIALWHGMPIKKMQFASNNFRQKDFNKVKYLQYMMLKTYNSKQRDVSIATSEATKNNLIECFELNPKSVFITGQPRNDVLFESNKANFIRKLLKHNSNNTFILYMPTWRKFNQHDTFLEDLIGELIDDIKFNQSLKNNNVTLYIKPHPRIILNAKGNNNIIVIQNSLNVDSQEILSAADVFVTDYSSAFIDYALLERPVHFYVPDLNEYKKSSNGLFYSLNSFASFWFKEIEVLKSVLSNHTKYLKQGLENSSKINSIFNDNSLKKGKYCLNVIQKLKTEKIIKNC